MFAIYGKLFLIYPLYSGAPVTQWIKRWPTGLAVPSSKPARGEIFSTVDKVPLHTAFHYHPPIVLIWHTIEKDIKLHHSLYSLSGILSIVSVRR